ncbi:MAG: adenosylhomocysteinase, partial [Methanomassiliicoccales archaeon]
MMADKDEGRRKIEWAFRHMHVLKAAGDQIGKEGKISGLKIGMAMHVEAKTAALAITLRDAGAEVRVAGCNPLSTDDDVASSLNSDYGIKTYARKGESEEEYYSSL